MDTSDYKYIKPRFKEDRRPKDKKPYKIPARKKSGSNGLKSTLKKTWGYSSQVDMFDDLWAKATKYGKVVPVCPFTNEKLDSVGLLWYNMFAHILRKSAYPLWRLNPNNIRIVYPEFHRIVDQGRLQERALHPEWKWDEWDSLVEEKKQEYEIFIKENL